MSTTPPSATPNSPVPATPTPASQPAHTPLGKLFLVVATALLLGWFAWLSYTALTKTPESSIISHAQAAAATVPVVVNLSEEPKKLGKTVKVVEPLTPIGPKAGTEIQVLNLPDSKGYTGPGDYLLLLEKTDVGDQLPMYLYAIAGQQRSPASDGDSPDAVRIYKWNDAVKAQVKRMFPQ
jgi:hypothetical protein